MGNCTALCAGTSDQASKDKQEFKAGGNIKLEFTRDMLD